MRATDLAVLCAGCALFGCDHQLVEAIVRGPPPDGALAVDATVDGSTCADDPGAEQCSASVWPNEHSRANSDAWLPAHHVELREIRPRVLIAHFINGMSVDELRDAADRLVEALAEGSRYHGYGNPNAPAFLHYEIIGIVDLTDDPVPADWPHPSSTRVPVDGTGAFDVAALFGEPFARLLGVTDPARPGEVLDLCELFRGGHINDLWLAVGDPGERHPPQMAECKARYDAAGRRIEGEYVSTGDEPGFCGLASSCGVSVRIAHFNPSRGLGCDLEVRGWAMRDGYRAIAYLDENARAFMNADFDRRFGASFQRFADICTPDAECVSYPSPTVAEGSLPDGTTWRIDPYEPGCGDPEYAPNARFTWDWDNPQPVQTRCAHYGLRDGPDGNDRYELYTNQTVAQATERWGDDCAGGWQMYWRQSIPGLDNPALDADGQTMKNWWVFSYY